MTFARLLRLVAGTFAALLALAVPAQDFPGRTMTLVVPFAPGSGTDQHARAMAQVLSRDLKVSVVVDNRAGANGFVAAQFVAKAVPDGTTLLLTTNTTHAANEHLYRKLPYDPVRDFTPIALLGKGHMFLLVNPNSPAKSVADLIAMARATPGKLNFGSGSSSSRVGGEMFRQLTGIQVVHVPYKANPLAITDLIGGQIDYMYADAPTAWPQVQAGRLRGLAVSGTRRLAVAPQVPTMEEAGVKGYDVSYWNAAYAPAGLPPGLTRRLNDIFVRAAQSPEMLAFQAKTSSEPVTSTSEELAAFQAAESVKWGRVIKAAGIEPE